MRALILSAALCFAGLATAAPPSAKPPAAKKAKKPKKEKPKKKRNGFEVGLSVQTLGKDDLTRTEKPFEVDIDLRPKLMGQFGFGSHDFQLTYNPRLLIPAKGPKQGDFDHLHRFRLDWKGKFGKSVSIKLRQDVEVGIKDFKTTVPAIDGGIPTELPDAPEEPAAGEEATGEEATGEEGTGEEGAPEEATGEETGGEEATGEETGGEEAPAEGDAGLEAGAEEEAYDLPDEEQLDEKLTLIEKVFTVKSASALGLDFTVSKTASIGVDAGFTRTGAIDDRAKKSYPEKLTPTAALRGSFSLGKSDKLMPKLKYEYSTFSTDTTSMTGAATLGWSHTLYKGATLGVGAGLAIASFETKTVTQAFLTPVTTLDLGFGWTPKGHKVDLKLGTALSPYASGASGVVVPRVSGTLGLGWKSKLGLYIKSSTSVVSSLTPQDYDPQGFTLIVDGTVGYAISPYFSVELGTQFQRNQKPDRGAKSFDPDDRLQMFLTLTGSSGLLP